MERLKRLMAEIGLSVLFGSILTLVLLWYLLEKGWLDL